MTSKPATKKEKKKNLNVSTTTLISYLVFSLYTILYISVEVLFKLLITFIRCDLIHFTFCGKTNGTGIF